MHVKNRPNCCRGRFVEIRGPAQEVLPSGPARRERFVLGQSRHEGRGVFAQRDRDVDGRRESFQQVGCRDPGAPGRARTSQRERGDEPRLEVVGIGLHRRHRLVVRDEHVAPRDRGASLRHQVVRHTRKYQAASLRSLVPHRHMIGGGGSGVCACPHRPCVPVDTHGEASVDQTVGDRVRDEDRLPERREGCGVRRVHLV